MTSMTREETCRLYHTDLTGPRCFAHYDGDCRGICCGKYEPEIEKLRGWFAEQIRSYYYDFAEVCVEAHAEADLFCNTGRGNQVEIWRFQKSCRPDFVYWY